MGRDRTAKNGSKDAGDGKDRGDDGHVLAMFLAGNYSGGDDQNHREYSGAAHSLESSQYDPFQYENFLRVKISAIVMATYNPSMEFAQPQAIENAVKSTRANRNMVFRPNISLNLA